MQTIIDGIKGDFKTEIWKYNPKIVRLEKLSHEHYDLVNQTKLFEDAKQKKAREEKQQKLEKEIEKLKQEIEEIKSNAIYKNAFEWRFEFPEVLNNEGNFEGFDVVIGNPPYSVIIENRIIEILKSNLRKWKSNILPDSYFGFIPLGLSLGNKYGQLSYIIPNTWRLINTAKDFRNEIVKDAGLYQIETYLKPVFEEAVVDCDIIFIDKTNKSDTVSLNVNSKDIFLKENIIPKQIILVQSSINSHLGIAEYKLIEKIKVNCENLNQVVKVKNGVKPYEVGKGAPKQTKKILEEKPFTQKVKIDKTFVPLIGGSDFNKYITKWNNDNFISYGPWLAAPRDKSIFEAKEKIIVRQTSDRLIATVVGEGFVMRNNTHILLSDKVNYELKYILSLLNSRLFDFVYWTINPERGEALAEVKAMHLDQLPIKAILKKDQKPFISLVDKIITQKQQGQDSTENEKEIDRLVYKLYDITEEEQRIIEGN